MGPTRSRQAFRIRRWLTSGKTSSDTAYHLSTEDAATRTANQWAKLVHDHWGIESRNHGRRDVCLFEHEMRGKTPFIVATFCIARSVLLYFNARTDMQNINAFAEVCRESKRTALSLIMRRRMAK